MALQAIYQSVQEEGAIFLRGSSMLTVKKTRSKSATEDSGGWGGEGMDEGMAQVHLEGLQSHAVGHTTPGLRSPPAAPPGAEVERTCEESDSERKAVLSLFQRNGGRTRSQIQASSHHSSGIFVQ